MPNGDIYTHEAADEFVLEHGYRSLPSRPGHYTNGLTLLIWQWLPGRWVRLHVID